MQSLMQERALLISDILSHAAAYHRAARVVSVRADGSRVRHGYPEIASRAARLAGALIARGVGRAERIATLAWSDHRHLEAYYAVSGIGAVCHTVNPRLFPEQVAFILDEGGATHLLLDPQFLPLVAALAGRLGPALRTLVVLADAPPAEMPAGLGRFEVLAYEPLLAGATPLAAWPRLDERTASSLCHTSGTTGEPKGVLYSHRSTVLHAMAVNMADCFGLRAVDVVLPAVPMFHVHAWGLPYAAPMVGAGMVLPGPRLDGTSLHALITEEGVTQAAGVPTLWQGLLAHLRAADAVLPRPVRLVIGGSACPPALARELEARGATVCHAWGMTETSPLGTFNAAKPEDAGEDEGRRLRRLAKQGRPGFGVALRIVDEDGRDLPHDGVARGELLVSGPWVAGGYLAREGDPAFTDGWLRTGDVATVDASGAIEIVDRAKDVIKSGGEWISSIALEAVAALHPAVAEAAAVAVPHPRWGERPLLLVVRREGHAPTRDDVLAVFKGRVADWWVPDEVVFVADLPHTATGKLQKTELKRRYRDSYAAADQVSRQPQVPQQP